MRERFCCVRDDARLIVVGSVRWVKRRFSGAMGCSACLWSYFRAGADARVVARGEARGRRREHARRRTGERRRSLRGDALVELECRASADRSCSAPAASHSGGPRAGAMRGGGIDSPRWARMSRRAAASVMKAMKTIGTAAHSG